MSNYEIFENYWNEACNSTIYYLRNSNKMVITKDQLNCIWRRELLRDRFRSEGDISHGAKRFLDGLIESDPEVGNKILKLLMDSSFDIGSDENSIAVGLGIGAASIIGGCAGSQKSRKNRKNALSSLAAVFGVTAAAGFGVAGKSVYDGMKSMVINEFEKKSAERLEVFKEVLE